MFYPTISILNLNYEVNLETNSTSDDYNNFFEYYYKNVDKNAYKKEINISKFNGKLSIRIFEKDDSQFSDKEKFLIEINYRENLSLHQRKSMASQLNEIKLFIFR